MFKREFPSANFLHPDHAPHSSKRECGYRVLTGRRGTLSDPLILPGSRWEPSIRCQRDINVPAN